MKKPDEKNESWSAFGLVSMIGADMAICTVGGVYLGMWLDRLWGTAPWMLLAGVLLGLGAGIYGVVRILAAFGPK